MQPADEELRALEQAFAGFAQLLIFLIASN